MGIARKIWPIVTMVAAACQPQGAFEVAVPGARPVAYEAIRDGSGVLGYAESLLGPDIATTYQGRTGPGTHAARRDLVAGAWELPAGTRPDAIAESLAGRGRLERILDRHDGQIWIADYRAGGTAPVRLMFIDGTSPAFVAHAVPEARPGPHVYLIAYRIP